MQELGPDYDGKRSLARFIARASALTDRVAACAIEKDHALTDVELEHIESLLAAFFYAISDRPYSSRSTEGASGNFQGQTGMGLQHNSYGQAALVADTSGCLAAIASAAAGGVGRATARGFWLGKRPSEQIPWWLRD